MRFLFPFLRDHPQMGPLDVLMNLEVVKLNRVSDQTARVAQGICLPNSHPGATGLCGNILMSC